MAGLQAIHFCRSLMDALPALNDVVIVLTCMPPCRASFPCCHDDLAWAAFCECTRLQLGWLLDGAGLLNMQAWLDSSGWWASAALHQWYSFVSFVSACSIPASGSLLGFLH